MSQPPFDPFASEEITPPFSAEWDAKRRVGKALKAITEALVTSAPPVDDLHRMADELEKTAAQFSRYRRIYGREAYAQEGGHGAFGQVSHEINPLSGLSNPIAPPIHTWIKGDRAFAKVTLNWAYEGPPGTVHGGIVAAIFDHFLGMAQTMGGQPGMTGVLTTHYHQRTPLNRELRLEAWLQRVDGRKTVVRGEMYAGAVKTASCEGLFIQPRGGFKTLKPL
jgi:acyl-coenzyme A thioesterase PaaI-like protein